MILMSMGLAAGQVTGIMGIGLVNLNGKDDISRKNKSRSEASIPSTASQSG